MAAAARRWSGVWRWSEEAKDAPGAPDTDLNVIQAPESGCRIDGLAFIEEAAHGVVGRAARLFREAVKMVHHGAIEKTGFGFPALVFGGSGPCGSALSKPYRKVGAAKKSVANT